MPWYAWYIVDCTIYIFGLLTGLAMGRMAAQAQMQAAMGELLRGSGLLKGGQADETRGTV